MVNNHSKNGGKMTAVTITDVCDRQAETQLVKLIRSSVYRERSSCSSYCELKASLTRP